MLFWKQGVQGLKAKMTTQIDREESEAAPDGGQLQVHVLSIDLCPKSL